MRGFSRVLIDLPYSLSTELSGPGMTVSLVSVGEERVEVEGRIIFPKRPHELTELAVFNPHQAGLKEGGLWEVKSPSFGNLYPD